MGSFYMFSQLELLYWHGKIYEMQKLSNFFQFLLSGAIIVFVLNLICMSD